MARFYGEIAEEGRMPVGKIGRKNLKAHIRGWNLGVKVECRINEEGKDEFIIYRTSGSSGESSDKEIAVVK